MDFANYADLTEAQKAEFLELVEILVAYLKKVRNKGLLAIEEDFEALKTEVKTQLFLKRILALVTGRVDPVIVRQIGENYIQYDTVDGFERLLLKVVLEGALFIQSGDSPRIMIETFASFVGIFESEKFISRFATEEDFEQVPVISQEKETEQIYSISQSEIDELMSGGAPAEKR